MMNVSRLLKILASCVAFSLLIITSINGGADQFKPFFTFIKAIDAMNSLKICWNQTSSHHCSYRRIINDVDCDHRSSPSNYEILGAKSVSNPSIQSVSKNPKRYHLQEDALSPSSPPAPKNGKKKSEKTRSKVDLVTWILLAIAVALLLLLILYFKMKSCSSSAKIKEINTGEPAASHSMKISSGRIMDSFNKEEEKQSELVFFVEEHERIGLNEILQSGTALHNQGRSRVNKIQLSYSSIFIVKRLTDFQGSFEEFGQIMRKIGNLKHQNLLPLIGYHSTIEEKHVIYRYQPNGSLLTLFEDYIQNKRDFPWELRLSIAVGIARGLDFIYRAFDQRDIIPHGNIKLSNILLSENDEPLLSEYGFSKFTSFRKPSQLPENVVSVQADDAFGFGVILIELLTGKIAAETTSGLDLVGWVKLKVVGGEWTGEIFDKEVGIVEIYGFPLLNIALKCLSTLPQERPSMSDVLEKIEEIVDAQSEISPYP